jgi:predicted transglutaminase-like cysteine proteinase
MVFMVLVCLVFVGCSVDYCSIMDIYLNEDLQFDNYRSLIVYINKNIEKKNDIEDFWNPPQKTVEDGFGDCEDFCILYIAMLKKYFNTESKLVLVEVNGVDHALVKVDGEYHEPQYWVLRNHIIDINDNKYNVIREINYNFVKYYLDY